MGGEEPSALLSGRNSSADFEILQGELILLAGGERWLSSTWWGSSGGPDSGAPGGTAGGGAVQDTFTFLRH
ncbi:hypothetical protein E2C01_042240 [Portunus trituberculatus]|uniref:Uncharacterized protein n=1 Tax=Portunus trituberculatus TaxID=210409 RepID=A0A5B7FSW5_PORTR|nr:hypothetical protein [Portunus trituberculatus]